jgi:hypothetical protein
MPTTTTKDEDNENEEVIGEKQAATVLTCRIVFRNTKGPGDEKELSLSGRLLIVHDELLGHQRRGAVGMAD